MIVNNSFRTPVAPPGGRSEPWSALELAAASETPWFAWHDGHCGRTLLGDQALLWQTDSADRRFARVAGVCSHLFERLSSDPLLVAFGFERGARVLAPCPAAPDRGWPGRELQHPACEALESWRARVRAALSAIHAGRLSKVVPARATVFEARPGRRFDVPRTLWSLRGQHPASITFAMSDGRSTFLGATPEILVRVRRGIVTTHAVAGTAARGRDAAGDRALGRALLDSPKEREEHAVVAAAIRSRLEPLCDVVEASPTPGLVRLSHVQHLVTPIRARLHPRLATGGRALLRLAEALHPTPAVCGSPREASSVWLRANEGLDRGWYAGPIGVLEANGDGVLAVAIRSATVTPSAAWACAGAGIVAGSDPDAEWRETELKLRTIGDALREVRR